MKCPHIPPAKGLEWEKMEPDLLLGKDGLLINIQC